MEHDSTSCPALSREYFASDCVCGKKGMRIALDEPPMVRVKSFTIFDPPEGLDPITVVLRDMGAGHGQILIDVFGTAWSHYWGAMGQQHIEEFIAGCGPDYIVSKLLPGDRRTLKRDEKYLYRIVRAVLAALRAEHP